eukprot:752953-Hanusia_phi.AAC.1
MSDGFQVLPVECRSHAAATVQRSAGPAAAGPAESGIGPRPADCNHDFPSFYDSRGLHCGSSAPRPGPAGPPAPGRVPESVVSLFPGPVGDAECARPPPRASEAPPGPDHESECPGPSASGPLSPPDPTSMWRLGTLFNA